MSARSDVKAVATTAVTTLTRRRTHRRAIGVAGAMLAAILTVSSCSSSTTDTSQDGSDGSGAPMQTVTLMTGAKNVIAADLPFVVAKESGFYADEGLDVNITFGDGYDTAIRLVGTGKADFAEADLASITGAVGEGIPVKSVAIYSQISPAGLVFNTAKPIKGPEDIKGMKIATSAGSGSGKVFDAWLKANNITDADFTRVVVPGHQKPIVFAQGQVDAYVGLGYDDLPEARKTGNPDNVNFYYFAENNIEVPGVAVAASNKIIDEKPDVVKKFLAATKKGFDSAKADVPNAVALAQKLQPTTNAKLLTDQWNIFLEAEQAAANTAWGSQSEEAWNQTIEVFNTGAPQPTSNYYTNDLLPTESK